MTMANQIFYQSEMDPYAGSTIKIAQ